MSNLAEHILENHFWIIDRIIKGTKDKALSDRIRTAANNDDSFKNAVFELGLKQLLKAGKKQAVISYLQECVDVAADCCGEDDDVNYKPAAKALMLAKKFI